MSGVKGNKESEGVINLRVQPYNNGAKDGFYVTTARSHR